MLIRQTEPKSWLRSQSFWNGVLLVRKSKLVLGAALVAAWTILPAAAEEAVIPRCTSEVAGSLSCQVNVACECRYYHASVAHGTPSGYRWDCGIRRPKCEVAPADAGYQGPYPDAIAIDRSTDIITQSQDSSQSVTVDDTP